MTTTENKITTVFVCGGGFYAPTENDRNRREFRLVTPSKTTRPYVYQSEKGGLHGFGLMRHHSHFYSLDLTTGVATLVSTGTVENDPSRYPPGNSVTSPQTVTLDEDTLRNVREVVNAEDFMD